MKTKKGGWARLCDVLRFPIWFCILMAVHTEQHSSMAKTGKTRWVMDVSSPIGASESFIYNFFHYTGFFFVNLCFATAIAICLWALAQCVGFLIIWIDKTWGIEQEQTPAPLNEEVVAKPPPL